MRTELIEILRRHSFLYSVVRRFYWQAKSFNAYLFGTWIDEKKWAYRKISEVEGDFSNLNHPHREFLVNEIIKFSPFSHILEIGCGYGPNLHRLAKKFPKIEMCGIDINSMSVEKGRKLLSRSGIDNVAMRTGKMDSINKLPDKSFDVVFTDAALIYVGPDKIIKVAKDMLRISRKALVILEWHENLEGSDTEGLGSYYRGCWKRNYKNLFKKFVPENNISVLKITQEAWPEKNWQEVGYLIKIVL